jgi:hypothetical protein
MVYALPAQATLHSQRVDPSQGLKTKRQLPLLHTEHGVDSQYLDSARCTFDQRHHSWSKSGEAGLHITYNRRVPYSEF